MTIHLWHLKSTQSADDIRFSSRLLAAKKDALPQERIYDDTIHFASEKIILASLGPPNGANHFTAAAQLACLSWRLPIEFMSSGAPPTPEEREQVANHMRYCLRVDGSFDSMVSLNPSEPLLSEAAAFLMGMDGFDAPGTMRSILQGFSVHKGDRGEMIGMLLLILARDACPRSPGLQLKVFKVTDFLCTLLQRRQEDDFMAAKPSVYQVGRQDTSLQNAFQDVFLHFNHIFKRMEIGNFTEDVLRLFLARNAGVMGANCQPGFDVLLVTAKGGLAAELTDKTMGIIMVQFKLDHNYSATIDQCLFDQMDPVTLGIVARGQELEVPIIRIVFALAGRTTALKVVTEQKPGSFTAYDIWVSGLSSAIYPALAGADERWHALRDFVKEDIYSDPVPLKSDIRKTATPLVRSEDAFLSFKMATAVCI